MSRRRSAAGGRRDGCRRSARWPSARSCWFRRSPSWRAGGEGAQPAVAVGVGELAVDKADAVLARLDRAMTQHQMREIDRPFVRRHVGALGHEAHVAKRAGLFDLGVVRLLHAVDFAGRAVVDQVEQPREGVAQIEAAAAAVADVEDALHLRFERLLVPEPGSANRAHGGWGLPGCLRACRCRFVDAV